MLETSVQVNTTIPNTLPEAVLRQAYDYPLKPAGHRLYKNEGFDICKKSQRSIMSPRNRDQKLDVTVSPRPTSSGSDDDIAQHHGPRGKKNKRRSREKESHRGQYYKRYSEIQQHNRSPTSCHNFNNSNNAIWERTHNHQSTFQPKVDAEFLSEAAEPNKPMLPIQPKPLRLSDMRNDKSPSHEKNKEASFVRSQTDKVEHESMLNRIRECPGDNKQTVTPPKSSRRYKSFGINEIMGETMTENDTDMSRFPSPSKANKRKVDECSSPHEKTKRRRSESDELSGRDNSPATSDYTSLAKDGSGLNGDGMSAMPLHAHPTQLPNPYIPNALAAQDPTLLTVAPHLLTDPSVLIRSALPRLGMNGINPYLLPHMLRRPMPGYDANQMLEQQHLLALLSQQAKAYPWYQMNPILRAMTNGANDPLVMASLLSAQKQAVDITAHHDMHAMYSAGQTQNFQAWNLQQNLIKQFQKQQEDFNKESFAASRNSGRAEQQTSPDSRITKSPNMKIQDLDHRNKVDKNTNVSCDKSPFQAPRHISSKSFHAPKKVSAADYCSMNSPDVKSNKKKTRVSATGKNPTRCSLPPKLVAKNEIHQSQVPTQSKIIDKTSDVPGDTAKGGGQSAPSKSASYKNLTRERRLVANARERTRVHTISSAFEELRSQIPSYSCNQKLSKLAILRIACSYIKSLSVLSGYDISDESQFDESVESCTKVLQSESRARSRRKSNRTQSDWDGSDAHNKSTGSSSTSPRSTHSDTKHKRPKNSSAKLNEDINSVFREGDSSEKYEDHINVED